MEDIREEAIKYLKTKNLSLQSIIDAKPSNLDELDVREAWDWIFSRTKYDDVDVGTKNQRKAFICENVELRPRNIARYIYMKAYEFKI